MEIGRTRFPFSLDYGTNPYHCFIIGTITYHLIEIPAMMAAVIGHVVGHKVRHVKTPLWMFYKAAKAQGLVPILLSGLRHYFQDHDRGAFAVSAPNDTIRELTGKDAEDFETIARRHAALPESRQSFTARVAACARFMAVPILPGFDPVAYDRAQEQPLPSTPHLALDDAGWTASHGIEGSVVVPSPLKEAFA
jgi:NAD(P)H dehydrogenase (quinone)